MLRIHGGYLKGRKILVPPEKITRPTTSRIRENIFNLLSARLLENDMQWHGLRTLDAFSGSGALGLEAHSRTQGPVTFIEKNRDAYKILLSNIEHIVKEQTMQVYCTSLVRAPAPVEPYDLIFLDPPYASKEIDQALDQLSSSSWSHLKTFFILETDARCKMDLGHFNIITDRTYARTRLYIFQRI